MHGLMGSFYPEPRGSSNICSTDSTPERFNAELLKLWHRWLMQRSHGVSEVSAPCLGVI